MLYLTKTKKNLPKFLYYAILSNKDLLSRYAVGSTVKSLRQGIFLKFQIPIPPIYEQRAIAKILSDLDSKIGLLQKQNKTLENIGQTIFKHWFVDFEFPNEKGEPYKSSGGEMTSARERERERPKGWEVLNIKEILVFEKGAEPGSSEYIEPELEGTIRFIRVGDLSSGRSQTFISASLKNQKTCSESDILLSLDATVGIVRLGLRGAYSSGIRKVYSKRQNISEGYTYFLLKSKYVQEKIQTYAHGTTILHAGESLSHMFVSVPEDTVLNKFSKIMGPVFMKILNNLKEIKKLEKVRDNLLPKLVTGKIRIADDRNHKKNR